VTGEDGRPLTQAACDKLAARLVEALDRRE
jgi:hypothetical protein